MPMLALRHRTVRETRESEVLKMFRNALLIWAYSEQVCLCDERRCVAS
jgi:hypothetical protein